jgi:hypothetical protein
MTKEEQIRREEDLIVELEAKVEIWQTLYREAKHCARIGMEPAIAIVHARHGLNAAKEQLHAHRASLETIKKRVSE